MAAQTSGDQRVEFVQSILCIWVVSSNGYGSGVRGSTEKK